MACFSMLAAIVSGPLLVPLVAASGSAPRRLQPLPISGLDAVSSSAELVQTAKESGEKLSNMGVVHFNTDFDFAGPTIKIDSKGDTGQTVTGFGGAFTEAAALAFKSLKPELQATVLNAYWGPGGIGLTMGRVPINSCDFSPKSYSFDDVWDDVKLKHFDNNVSHDAETMIPFIKAARDTVRRTGTELKLLACPWSPPAWMKNNGKMDSSATPGLKDSYHDAWATYITKWISAYKAHGVPIWAITPQNEPEYNAPWEACLYTAEQEIKWVGGSLGPILQQAHPEVQIFVYDHNKDHVYDWAKSFHSHPGAAQYVSGVAYHWYLGDHFDNLAKVRQDFPQLQLLASEATYEKHRWSAEATMQKGEWSFGEGYAHDIIGDLNNGAIGWIDWNLLLDENGGPNHKGNMCDAAIIAGPGGQSMYIHPQFYFIGHFSKYIVRWSKFVSSVVKNSRSYTGSPRPYGTCTAEDGLQATSFLRPDDKIAVVVLNCGDDAINFKLQDGARAIKASIPAHAIQTYMFSKAEVPPEALADASVENQLPRKDTSVTAPVPDMPTAPGCYHKQLSTPKNPDCGAAFNGWKPDTWGKVHAHSWDGPGQCMSRKKPNDAYCGTDTKWLFVAPHDGGFPSSRLFMLNASQALFPFVPAWGPILVASASSLVAVICLTLAWRRNRHAGAAQLMVVGSESLTEEASRLKGEIEA